MPPMKGALSRIWGGIHPPADDIPGRKMGIKIGKDAFAKAVSLFFVDADEDGYLSFEDCDDSNPNVNPGMTEICDSIDNNCNQLVDEELELFNHFLDQDGDGFGTTDSMVQSCDSVAPVGYVAQMGDCNDTLEMVNPDMVEICDSLDNDCNGMTDEGLEVFTYYADTDNDGFGDSLNSLISCLDTIIGYVSNSDDCDDENAEINPSATEIPDNMIDENCDGLDFEVAIQTILSSSEVSLFPNPAIDVINIELSYQSTGELVILDASGRRRTNPKSRFRRPSSIGCV